MYKAHTIIYHVYFKLDWEIYNVSSLRFRYLCTVCGRMNWFWENWPILPVKIYKYIYTMEHVKTIEQAAAAVATHTHRSMERISSECYALFNEKQKTIHQVTGNLRKLILFLCFTSFYACLCWENSKTWIVHCTHSANY